MQQGPHRKWQRLAAVAVVLALGACGTRTTGGEAQDVAADVGVTDAAVDEVLAEVDGTDGDVADVVVDVPDASSPDVADVTVVDVEVLDAVDGIGGQFDCENPGCADATCDGSADVSIPDASSATCGWPNLVACPCGCPGDYPCGPCGNGNGCGWAAMPKMSTPRQVFESAWGDDGLYVWGGISDAWALPGASGPPGAQWWNGLLATGEKWDPKTNTWTLLPQAPLLPAIGASVVWAGDRLIVLGRNAGGFVYPANPVVPWTSKPVGGAMWLPKQGQWKPMADWPPMTVGPPQWVADGSILPGAVVWTGKQLLAAGWPLYWGGKSGAAYDPATDVWTELPPLPPGREKLQPACWGWTGDRLMIWDASWPYGVSYLPDAATWETFDPGPGEAYLWAADSCVGFAGGLAGWGRASELDKEDKLWIRPQAGPGWQQIQRPGWLPNLSGNPLAWSGKYLIVWGGVAEVNGTGEDVLDGALYDPVAKVWLPIPKIGAPSGRDGAATVANAGVLYLMGGGGGQAYDVTFPDGGRLLLPP